MRTTNVQWANKWLDKNDNLLKAMKKKNSKSSK